MENMGAWGAAPEPETENTTAAPEEKPPQCPRCESLDTKFAYYNNYNLAQPRHFCRACRRYWTKGGKLLDVPVGGGTRTANRPSAPKKRKRHRRLSTTVATVADPDDQQLLDAQGSFCELLGYDGLSEELEWSVDSGEKYATAELPEMSSSEGDFSCWISGRGRPDLATSW